MTLPSFSGTLSVKEWESLSDEELDALAVVIFNYYRERGVPYYELTEYERLSHFNKLYNFFNLDPHRVIDGDKINMSMHGLALAWHYFPHAWDIKVGKMHTPKEVFNDDKLFLAAIRKRFKRGTYFSDSGIRKTLRTHSGAQGVSNFRPTAAAGIYHRYLNSTSNTVWDMSGGFGGRLLGASVCGKISHYIATDPSSETVKGLNRLGGFVKSEIKYFDFEILEMGSEFYLPAPESLDFCFTSPPYFDTEQYADESSQSYIAYPSVEAWNENFLRPTVQNCMFGLKSGAYMALNVANVKSHPNLEADTVRIAREEGFSAVETLKLSLSNVAKGGYKFEPVFVFRKG